MSEIAIRLENIGKRYTLKHRMEEGSDSLVGAFAGGFRNFFRNEKKHETREDFWAVRSVSFDVAKGDRVGIIGRNGAGKSTLLKILSKIVKPTTGRIEYEGRMSSLLEVGTGFHGDLTGRENIYLNGSILGMNKSEISRKFDEIVAFSEVEQFLDTPVKRYSSGMYVRLAFAVAAHLEPDILIVDEVLAVGDAAFQQKCIGKMNDVSAKEGRTILFVSHQMATLTMLCNRSVLMEKGSVVDVGPTPAIIQRYMSSGHHDNGSTADHDAPVPGSKMKIRSVGVYNHLDKVSPEINNAFKAYVKISFEVLQKGRGYDVSLEVKHVLYGSVFTTCLKDGNTRENDFAVFERGMYTFTVELPMGILRAGEYVISAGAAVPKVEELDKYRYDTVFHILDSVSPVAVTQEGRNGVVLPVITWQRV